MKFIAIFAVTSSILASVLADLAPLHRASGDEIKGRYIIKLKSNTRSTIEAHIESVKRLFDTRSESNKIRTVYKHLGKSYSAQLTDNVLEKVRALPDVEYIESDTIIKIDTTQTDAPWGLARISQRTFTEKSTYTYNGDGAGVTVYVIDTGILTSHPEFEGRARTGARFVGLDDNDGNGHGTHCAGIIGSKTYGVAKKASIVALKVFDASGSGSTSDIISAIDWTVNNHKSDKIGIINMSLGGRKTNFINDAVKAAFDKGFLIVVSAGNNANSACFNSPASAPEAITVANSGPDDKLSPKSNWGSCVDIIAPGTNVTSTWNNGETKVLSGTSMAAPHVAGLAAYYLSQGSLTNAQLTAKIISSSTKNAITNLGSNTPNLLAYNSIV